MARCGPAGCRRRVLAGVVLALALVTAGCAGGDEGSSTRSTSGTTASATGAPEADAALRQAIDELIPSWTQATGENDRDRLLSLLDVPDAFTLSFEPGDGGALVRHEAWTYYELQATIEFLDGRLAGLWGAEPPAGVVIVPRWFEPAAFDRATALSDVEQMLAEPAALVKASMPESFGEDLTAYAADQLLVVFDPGGLVYVETFPVGAP